MIGNPKWFEVRKYGWGLKPKSWQGWVYIGLTTAIMPIILLLDISNNYKMACLGIWFLFMLIDSTDIMIRMKKDERQITNEALAERNVSWFMIFLLGAILIYQAIQGTMLLNVMIIPIVSVILGALIIKILTYWHLEK